MKKSRICKQVWSKPYYLAVKHSNIVKYEQCSPCSILEVIGSQHVIQDIQVVDNFVLDLPLMFKVHKMWSVDTQENF